MNVAPISFCGKIAFNVRHDKYKTNLLEQLFKLYNIIVTDNNCHIYNKQYARLITQSTYLLSTNTTGNRYFLYFTKDVLQNNLCFFIDKKICKGYQYPRIIYTKFRFTDKVFNGTLLYGELIKDVEQNWIFLINDIFSFCGEKLFKINKIDRIKKIYYLFNNYYKKDPILDVCNFQIKRYFEYKNIHYLLNTFIPQLKYNINGLLFNGIHFKQPNILLLNQFSKNKSIKKPHKQNNLFTINEKPINIKPITQPINIKPITQPINTQPINTQPINTQPINTTTIKNNRSSMVQNKTFNFIIERTKQGIFQLISFINKNKKVFGFARIDSLQKQKMIIKLLSTNNNLIMKCKYNLKFKKFIPIEQVTVTEPDQYLDVTKYVSNTVNS